ncbi:heterotrimeric G protein alpha subunit 4 [Thelephora terrestris]|uniref:Heterotrimeric G protein alpha subunit 4 n=1 Tax=Thelephora terrestris TaxID=56493 RepID=A0A9P6LA97_9AGAM|nr:heterotrimeric G protein alpha subunit 4 [Thelephora terrestris]
MGACTSSQNPWIEVSEEDRRLHREAEQALKAAKLQMASQVKVLLLGSGDAGGSTFLKQMRLIHHVPFSSQEIEDYRQLVFNNLTFGLRCVFEAMEHMELEVSIDNVKYLEMLTEVTELSDGEPFPIHLLEPLKALWADANVQKACSRGNEADLPENLHYYFSDLERLFDPHYTPNQQDIFHCTARTTGITETRFNLRDYEMLVVDVGGQKSERRKWIHCFQDVTNVLFLVNLSGYDQHLVEDRDANQMQDAMAIWESICRSQWFRSTSIILVLNHYDLFEKKVRHSPIKNFFPDYEGEPGDPQDGRDYFKRRFARLAQKFEKKEREVYIHVTSATDTAMLRVVMAAVEGESPQSFPRSRR